MLNRIRNFLTTTTGLTSPLKMRPVSKDAFVAAFAMPPGNAVDQSVKDTIRRGSPDAPGESVGRVLFETGLDTLQMVGEQASNVPGMLYSTVKRVGLAITRFIHPEGGAISVVSDSDGRSVDAASIGMTTKAARAAASADPVMSPVNEARHAAETVMRYRVQSVAQSPECVAFRDFINPIDEYGNVQPSARMGWSGLIHAVRGLPTPGNAAGMEGVMDIVGGRDLKMGVSVLTCKETKAKTLQSMLNRALDLNLSIPPRADGQPWNSESPIDRELASARCGRPDSPFIAGKMKEGSPVLLNDANLIDLGNISRRLSPAALERTFAKVRNTMEQKLRHDCDMASSIVTRNQAQAGLDEITNSHDFGSLDDIRNANAGELGEKRLAEEKAAEQRRKDNPGGLDALIDDLESGKPMVSMNVLEEEPEPTPLPNLETTWSEVSMIFSKWSPGEGEVTLRMKDGIIEPTVHLPDHMMELLGATTPEVKSMEGFILTDLMPGTYPVEGGEPLTIKEVNGVRSIGAMPEPDKSPEPEMAPAPKAPARASTLEPSQLSPFSSIFS